MTPCRVRRPPAPVPRRDLKSLCQTRLSEIGLSCRVLGACDETIGAARTYVLMGLAGTWADRAGDAGVCGRLLRDRRYPEDFLALDRFCCAVSTSRRSTGRFCPRSRATPDKYQAALLRAIERGWIVLHESGTFVRFTQADADLFARWRSLASRSIPPAAPRRGLNGSSSFRLPSSSRFWALSLLRFAS
jgi:hypothetical protein